VTVASPGTTIGVDAPMLPGRDAVDELVADRWATGLSPDTHPVQFVRHRDGSHSTYRRATDEPVAAFAGRLIALGPADARRGRWQR
jgi:hypothetical protein